MLLLFERHAMRARVPQAKNVVRRMTTPRVIGGRAEEETANE
jgi:hypothetical protein